MSDSPLIKKLGIKPGMTVSLIDVPEDLYPILGDLPDEVSIVKIKGNVFLDFIHAFYTREKDLVRDIYFLKSHLKKDGMLWISWPKGGSFTETDLNRDSIRKLILNEGLVDIKICSVNEKWSALKFVYRRKDRNKNED